MKNCSTLLFLVCLLLNIPLIAQDFPSNNYQLPPHLNNVPPMQVRTMAEWEEVAALVISWESDIDILLEIVRHAVEECHVYIFSPDNTATTFQIATAGISLDNITILPYSTNTVWIRDYGPWTVYQEDVSTLAFSDFLYNRPSRFKDDTAPYRLAETLDIPLYNADENPFELIHTGGNFLRDGMGTGYSSDLVLRENSGKTGLEIENFMRLFFGITDYRLLNRLDYDTIHHLDMHIRTLDEETLAVGLYPEGVADGPKIEANLDYLRDHYRTPFGNPYHIIRQEMPSRFGTYPPISHYQTYTNAVFINKTLLVPTYGQSFNPASLYADSVALAIYRKHLPGYNVVGINCNSIIHKLGALHCITKLIGVKDPLRISHPRLRDVYHTEEGYEVNTWVQHKNGIESVFLHYRLEDELYYDSIAMTQNGNDLELWTANIPSQASGSTVQYYISAHAVGGKYQVRPLPAPEGYFDFKVKAFESAPTADFLQSLKLATTDMSILFTDLSKNGYTSLNWQLEEADVLNISDTELIAQYPEAGTYTVQLISTNPLGSDTLTKENTIEILEPLHELYESFEGVLNNNWRINNSILEWETWQGNCHNQSIRIAHTQADRDLERNYLRIALDLSELVHAGLTFDVAYAVSDSLLFDELRVNLIDEDGKRNNVYNKGGDVLATIEEHIPNFEPLSCEQWRSETIDFGPWEGQKVIIEFETIGDRGNNMYLDNIRLRADALPHVSVTHPIDGSNYVFAGETTRFDTISVQAFDPDGNIVGVSFFANTQFLGYDTVAPYEWIYELPEFGQYCYTAKAKDNDNLQVWAQQICINYSQYSANNELSAADGLQVNLSPNPAKDMVFLQIQSLENIKNAQLTIFDLQQKIVRQEQLQIFAGNFQYPINIEQLPSASYLVHIQTDNEQLTRTLIIP